MTLLNGVVQPLEPTRVAIAGEAVEIAVELLYVPRLERDVHRRRMQLIENVAVAGDFSLRAILRACNLHT